MKNKEMNESQNLLASDKIFTSSTNTLTKQVSKFKKSNFKKFLIIALAMFISACASRYFIIFCNIFSSGVSGVSQGIVYTTLQATGLEQSNPDLFLTLKNVGYYIVNIFFNIFIALFAIRKFGKEFTYWSLGAFFTSILWAFFLSYVPGFNSAGFIPGYKPVYQSDGAVNVTDLAITFAVTSIAATIGGLLAGVSTGMVLKLGYSTMGLDPISKNLARTKNISVKKTVFIFSMLNSLFWIIIQNSIAGFINSFQDFMSTLVNARVLGTVILQLVNSLSIGIVYPAGKKVALEVNTTKGTEISLKLNNLNYHRPHSIYKAIGGRSKAERDIVKIILMEEEMFEFIDLIAEVDEFSFISVFVVLDAFGNFNSNKRFKDLKQEEIKRKNSKRTNKTISKISPSTEIEKNNKNNSKKN